MAMRKAMASALLLAGCAFAPTEPAGEWGGERIALVISGEGGEIESDCAHGRIDGPFVLDPNGAFLLPGIWSREHGGPVREGEAEEELAARFSGWIAGDAMTLNIDIVSPPSRLGSFDLRKNRAPKLLKCL